MGKKILGEKWGGTPIFSHFSPILAILKNGEKWLSMGVPPIFTQKFFSKLVHATKKTLSKNLFYAIESTFLDFHFVGCGGGQTLNSRKFPKLIVEINKLWGS